MLRFKRVHTFNLTWGKAVGVISENRTANDYRDKLREKAVNNDLEQYCIYMSLVDGRLQELGFASLYEFVTASFSKGGLSLSLEQVKVLLYFNPSYKHYADELWAKINITEAEAKRLKQQAEAKNLASKGKTQQQIADALGITRQTVSRLIKAEAKPKPKAKVTRQPVAAVTVRENQSPKLIARKVVETLGVDLSSGIQKELNKRLSKVTLQE